MHTCVYIYIYTYTYIHIHIHLLLFVSSVCAMCSFRVALRRLGLHARVDQDALHDQVDDLSYYIMLYHTMSYDTTL